MTNTDYSSDLDDYIAEPPDLVLMESPEVVEDADRANRILRRLMRLQENAQQVQDTAAAEILRISQWEDERLKTIAAEATWHTQSVEGFMRVHHAKTGAKSLALPNGTLKLRKPSVRTVVDDEAEAIEWAKVNRPDAVKETLLRSKFADGAEAFFPTGTGSGELVDNLTGEKIPGVHLESDVDLTFTVKAGA